MHPKDLHMAVIAAVTALEQLDVVPCLKQRTKPTKRDLAAALPRMNDRELSSTLKNLTRRHNLRIVNTVKVDYCCKPVGVYSLYDGDTPKTMGQWHESLALWAGLK
jgi:hypothetical protein